MVRLGGLVAVTWGALAVAASGDAAFAHDVYQCPGAASAAIQKMTDQSTFATVQQPARIVVGAGPGLVSESSALRLTLRPTAVDPNAPFLAEVFAVDLCNSEGKGLGQLVGTVSFFPLKVGQSQDFVLPAPEKGFLSIAPQRVQLTVKLVPANPARTLNNASVEVLNAKFAD